jgi:hypothetical protein
MAIALEYNFDLADNEKGRYIRQNWRHFHHEESTQMKYTWQN